MRQNPLSLLFVFALVGALPYLSHAQVTFTKAIKLPATEELLALRVERLETRLQWGPHRKNARAAGRRMQAKPVNRKAVVPSTRLRLTGPRYKNRGAKARS